MPFMSPALRAVRLLLVPLFLAACGPGDGDGGAGADAAGAGGSGVACDPGNAGLSLPDGFCALVVADDLGPVRHLAVAANGDLFVAVANQRGRGGEGGTTGGILALRDADGDGRAEVRERWGENGGNDVLLRDGFLYFAPDDAVLRYALAPGSLTPTGAPDTIVAALPGDRNHAAKSIAIGADGALYVNIGAPSNACQTQPRTPGSPGLDPCPQLVDRGGIWRFDANRTGQRQGDGARFATGLRNVVALGMHPDGTVYGAVHGRDQLAQLFPDFYDLDQSAEKPSEEFGSILEGDDYGWPYCYHDPESGRKVLAPEYGGDGEVVGRCAEVKQPAIGFPAHWAPDDIVFYTGEQFPAAYRGGAFIAFHGSWNRAPRPQAGYRVVFAPFAGGAPTGTWETFADDFAGVPLVEGGPQALHRPTGLALGPDGSLYVSDDTGGRIWRILHTGP